MRLGIFGGSFDPVHFGHVTLAGEAVVQSRLDAVWLVPAAQQPLKPAGPLASADDRCAMIELAISDSELLRLSRHEIERGGTSYTVETLRAIAVERPNDRLFLLMGADSLHDLPKWYEPAEICRLALPLVVCRAGEPPPDFQILCDLLGRPLVEVTAECRIEMPPMAVSSSTIRQRVAAGRSIEGLTPAAVGQYIDAHSLYR